MAAVPDPRYLLMLAGCAVAGVVAVGVLAHQWLDRWHARWRRSEGREPTGGFPVPPVENEQQGR